MSFDKNKYVNDYVRTHMHRISLNLPNADYDRLRAAADAAGVPVATYIKRAINNQIQRDSDPNS